MLALTWHCLQCAEKGTTDKEAEKHTKDFGHGTVTKYSKVK